jgi:hypothetical protein
LCRGAAEMLRLSRRDIAAEPQRYCG